MSNYLWPHGLQHTRFLCPLPCPGVSSNSCPLSWWCHLTILSSVVAFSSSLPFFLASVFFPMSQLLISGGQSIGVSAWVLPMNIQDWFTLGSPCSPRDSQKSLLQHHSSKASILWHSALFMVQLSHPYITTWKIIAWTIQTFVGKVMSLLYLFIYFWLCGSLMLYVGFL